MDLFGLDTRVYKAKPFLKWAGGKTQLIDSISLSLPKNIEDFDTYIEPFIGSGAIMFWFLKKYPHFKKAVINDINTDLINVYISIKECPYQLIEELAHMQDEYYCLNSEEERKHYFLNKRTSFNEDISIDGLKKSAIFIFLNRTCFNGLYRVNSKNKFNVPFGKYLKPKILDKETILADSDILQKVIILNGDYSEIYNHISGRTFVYLDPPYKPLSETASFNSYSFEAFNDEEQYRLFRFCELLNENNINWLLSNSDPKNTDKYNNFFDNLYQNFNIERVEARRNINSNASKRGKINEILINNYL